MSTMPTRIDGDLFEAAKASGALMSRSAAQQLSHWARLGRELESSRQVSHKDIARVLAGRQPYDSLGDPEQAVVRAEWDERIDAARAALDLESELAAAGESWSEVDAAGNLVVRHPG
ncbi:hypothetical protein [Nocardioides sp.]|uniref:TA system antitoxin ParD family protein n=1 Tax=Nocardioides sp. TaxID=35761 RepID=UPI00272526C5|nr:hypothetical protein [Nocardioides sp.]MDO9454523.1 hypothetical protein [Nocardioides sp.]